MHNLEYNRLTFKSNQGPKPRQSRCSILMLRSILHSLGDDAGGAVAEPDGRLALVAVLAAGAGRLERAHLALPHQLVVAHPQIIVVAALAIVLPLSAAAVTGTM